MAFREIAPHRRDEFVAAGVRRRDFFPHRIYRLPKCGPDGYMLHGRMAGERDPGTMWELLLHAGEPVLSEFPAELFFDDDLQWHRQQFGLPGHLATVNVSVRGDSVHTTAHVSDLVQRIGRRREHKTRVEKRFGGWDRMLLNGVLDFALERGARWVYLPTAEHAMENTDRARSVDRELFERVYDRHPQALYPTTRAGRWWRIDAVAAARRVVRPASRREPLPEGRAICVFHDTERGLGHVAVDPTFAAAADRSAPQSLTRMLAAERAAGTRATYNVVGCLLGEVREEIERGGHCLAFHSYDHEVAMSRPAAAWRFASERAALLRHGALVARGRPLARRVRDARRAARERLRGGGEGPVSPQLDACRRVDYRLKGYRPPQSWIAPDLADENLLFYNFEWLASGPHSLGVDEPVLRDRLVRLPVTGDDFDLHRGTGYDSWEAGMLRLVSERGFAAVGLHDCYGPHWLDRYPRFLDRLQALGRLATLDEVAAEATLAAAV